MNFTEQELEELLRESLFGAYATCECFCTECGEYVTDAEYDADYKMYCPACDKETRVASPLRYYGYI